MCPPGVDQTGRSAQRWTFLAPSLKQNQALWLGDRRYDTEPIGLLCDGLSWGAFEKLARPTFRARAASLALPQPIAGSESFTTSSLLESMPAEMISMVTSKLEPADLVALAMTSHVMWAHGIREVQASYQKTSAPWADTPIICTGTYLEDLPSAIYDLNPGLREATDAWLNGMRRSPMHGMSASRGWNWASYSSYQAATSFDLEARYLEALAAHRQKSGIPDIVFGSMRCSLSKETHWQQRPLSHSSWCLRNLVTKEFVELRLSGRKGSENMVLSVPKAPWLTLDILLLSRIMWTQPRTFSWSPASAIPVLKRIKRGIWAGHRFDIVEASSSQLDCAWRDVTKEVLKEGRALRKVLRSSAQYQGPDDHS